MPVAIVTIPRGGGGGAAGVNQMPYRAVATGQMNGEAATLSNYPASIPVDSFGNGPDTITATLTYVTPQQFTCEVDYASSSPVTNRQYVAANVTPVPIALPTAMLTGGGTVCAGQSKTLTYTTANAASVTLTGDDGSTYTVTPNITGTVMVTPSGTTVYTLTATNDAGSVTSVQIVGITPPPGVTFTISPPSGASGSARTLTWTTTNATSASIDNGVGVVTPTAGGSVTVSPSATTTYTITATNGCGTQSLSVVAMVNANTCTATATVAFAPPAVNVQCTLTANPATITAGGTSTLLLTTQNATSAALDNGIGPVVLTGGNAARDVSPAVTTTYNAVAQGAWLTTASAEATVTVNPAASVDPCGCSWKPKSAPTCGTWTKRGC